MRPQALPCRGALHARARVGWMYLEVPGHRCRLALAVWCVLAKSCYFQFFASDMAVTMAVAVVVVVDAEADDRPNRWIQHTASFAFSPRPASQTCSPCRAMPCRAPCASSSVGAFFAPVLS